MSNIIKAKNVYFDNSKNIQIKADKKNESDICDLSKEDLYGIYNQREIILKEANKEALKIINTAKRNAQLQIEEIKKNAYEEGYNAGNEIGKNKGYEEGFKLGNEEATNSVNSENKNRVAEIESMLTEIESEKDIILAKYKDNLEQLAISIAEKIIKQKINLKEDIISKIIEDVIKDYKNVEWVKVYISSEDEAHNLEADKAIIKELKKISGDVKIVSSKELSKGSLVVETPDSIIDAGVNTQLNNLKELILNKQEK